MMNKWMRNLSIQEVVDIAIFCKYGINVKGITTLKKGFKGKTIWDHKNRIVELEVHKDFVNFALLLVYNRYQSVGLDLINTVVKAEGKTDRFYGVRGGL